MNADTKQDYTIDEVALWKADINPRTCHGSVRFAVDRQLPGYEKAESYLEQLEEQIAAGVLQPSCVEKPPEFPPEGGFQFIVVGTDTYYLSAEDARNWQPEQDNPLKPAKGEVLSGKSLTTHRDLIKALVTLIEKYESGERKAKEYPHNRILFEDGTLNKDGLHKLLKDTYKDTPASANKMIAEAIKPKS